VQRVSRSHFVGQAGIEKLAMCGGKNVVHCVKHIDQIFLSISCLSTNLSLSGSVRDMVLTEHVSADVSGRYPVLQPL
jgi:hypothetical protein